MASPNAPNGTEIEVGASYDVVIVGGGIAAAALAFALSQRPGLRILALPQAGPAMPVAPGPAVLRASHSSAAMVRMAIAAAAPPKALRAEMSPVRRPLLEVAFTPEGLARSTRLADMARHLGAKAWLVPPLEVRSHLPFARLEGEGALLGALFEPEAAVIDRESLASALAAAAAKAGAPMRVGPPVSELVREGDAVVGVRAGSSVIRAAAVVLAPEGARPRFPGVDLAGLGPAADTMLLEAEPAAPVFSAAVVSRRFGTLFQSEAAVTCLGAVLGPEGSAARAMRLAALVDALPGLGGLFLRRQTRARTLTTLDGAPIAGRLAPGLHLIAGLGFEHAALALPIAAALAEEIGTGQPGAPLAPFAPARFADGRLLAPPAEAAAA